MAPATAGKDTELAFAGTVTVAGTVSALDVLLMLMVVPPAGALLDILTVHTVAVLGERLEASHCSELVPAVVVAGASATEALAEEPFQVAVTPAVCAAAMFPAVAVKVAEAAPAAIVTLAGTVRLVEFDCRVTAAPPAGAPALSVTVQVAEAAGPSVAGLQESEVTVTGGAGGAGVTVMLPPLAVTVNPAPVTEAPTAPLTPTAAVDALWLNVKVATATTPLPMVFKFGPQATQTYVPALPCAQDMDLPPAVADAPAVTVTFVIAVGG
jgi:hypothetical protein